jgi:chemotaxis protein MotB
VRGFADQKLRVPGDPFDPSNRRISLIVQWEKGEAAKEIAGSDAKQAEGAKKEPAERKK